MPLVDPRVPSRSTRSTRASPGLGRALVPIGLSLLATGALAAPGSRLSDRSVSVALEVSRDSARLHAYALKERPYFTAAERPAPVALRSGAPVQLELVLSDRLGGRFTRRVEVGPLCLRHGPDTEPHVEGDTILLHRDVFIVELPELAGFDRFEAAVYEEDRGRPVRRSLVLETLDAPRFTPAGGGRRYLDLRFADPDAPPAAASSLPSDPIWPEDFGDVEIYRVYGDVTQSQERLNVVIVPDGYTYAEKDVMEAHADALVAHFRDKTPYAEHDPFINYALVYAYSIDSGTDECDCGVVRDTAMGTRFPDAGEACGHSANRCLYYGSACDGDGTSNIAAAELRAPAHDTTIVMVNTERYGGCGGSRAVFAAGNALAAEIAVHELGHSLAGLADEYGGSGGCGIHAGEINTSSDRFEGAWPEWIEELGPPEEGAQYYDSCLFRPSASCEMRSLNQPFCPVCNQRWSLVFFGHPRIAPTAPLRGTTPASPLEVRAGLPASFGVETRLSVGAATHRITWRLLGPDDPSPVLVATGSPSVDLVFDQTGHHELSCEIVADANFVKPERYGANVDVAIWSIDVVAPAVPPEVSAAGTGSPLEFTDDRTLIWEAGSGDTSGYNLYRGELDALDDGFYGRCLTPDVVSPTVEDPAFPGPSAAWFYLVAARNSAGEGTLGEDSSGSPRTAEIACE